MAESLKGTQPTLEGMPAPDGGAPVVGGTEQPGAAGALPPPGSTGPEANQPGPAEVKPTGPDGTAPLSAETRDRAARYTDRELLGRKYPVRQAVHETATQSVRAWQSVGARLKNATETPGKWWKHYAKHRAKIGLDKKQSRLEAAKTSSEIFINHRQEKVKKAQTLLVERTTRYTGHKDRMEKRVTDVGEHATEQRKMYIKELKKKRVEALARKARKTVRRQLRQEGASRREARAIIGEMPEKHLKKIGKVAIVEETSRRKQAQAERGANRAVRRHDRTERRIGSAETRLQGHTQKAEFALKTADHLRAVELPRAEAQVAKLSAKLETIDPDDPAHAGMTIRLRSAEQLVDSLNQHLAKSEWAASHSQYKTETTQEKLGSLNERHSGQAEAVETAKARLQERQAITTAHQGDLAQGITVALNPGKKKKSK